MAIDTFTKAEFEAALPQPYISLGIVKGEECYVCCVDDKTGVLVRSSVSPYGWSASLGADSIRLLLVQHVVDDFNQPEHEWTPISAKVDTWTSRVHGWEKRMNAKIATLKRWRVEAGDCPICHNPRHIYRSHSEKNPDRLYAKCNNCTNQFSWIEE